MQEEVFNWGVISTGKIAVRFAGAIAGLPGHARYAVASRTEESARTFAGEHGFAHAFASYEAMLGDPKVDGVYIATPHPLHLEWVLKAAAAGKAILCEKPMTMNAADTGRAIAAARENGVFLAEAFMYRAHPQTRRLLELIRDEAIGPVRAIRAHFAFRTVFNPEHRLWSRELGGGGILDVGCYPVSIARLVAGAATGRDFAEPVRLQATGVLAPNGVDAHSTALLDFESGIYAELSCGVGLHRGQELVVYGDRGSIRLDRPFTCTGKIEIFTNRQSDGPVVERVGEDLEGFSLEAELVRLHHRSPEPPAPAMSHADSLGNARALDAWLERLGVVY